MASSLRVSSLSCVLLLSALYAPAMAFERAQEVPQMSRRQQDFLGGWAIGIAGTECPASVAVLCTGIIKNPACCPVDTFCFGTGNTYCCPTETDCLNSVTNFPKCADASWTMYILQAYAVSYFCCPAGQFGVLPLSSKYGGLCVAEGEQIPASRIATKAAAAKVTVTSITRPIETITLTSISNGRVTTITTTSTGKAVTVVQTASVGDATTVPKGTETTAAAANTDPPAASKGGLGAGPIAGIAIGGLGVLALFLVAFMLYRRRKPAAAPPAPSYSYAPPPHQNQPDMGVYPPQYKSPALSNAATATVVGSPAPQQVQPQHGYEHYGPPPPAAGYSEVQGQNTWEGPGRSEIGPGR